MAVVGYWDLVYPLPILLGCVMILMGERKVLAIIAIPIMFDVFAYVVFYRIFNIMPPTVYCDSLIEIDLIVRGTRC